MATLTFRNKHWIDFINDHKLKHVAEIGVWKGDFTEALLRNCPAIETYIMIDPWARLPDWNKPFNVSTEQFEKVYNEAILKTDFALHKRKVLRGEARHVLDSIQNESLDFVYIDGDHTLRGITLDLISIYPKVKKEAFIAGDDFDLSPWEHSYLYEPTLVCPYVLYFAEAMKLPVTIYQEEQFLIQKTETGYTFHDTTGKFKHVNMKRMRPNLYDALKTIKWMLLSLIR